MGGLLWRRPHLLVVGLLASSPHANLNLRYQGQRRMGETGRGKDVGGEVGGSKGKDGRPSALREGMTRAPAMILSPLRDQSAITDTGGGGGRLLIRGGGHAGIVDVGGRISRGRMCGIQGQGHRKEFPKRGRFKWEFTKRF